MCPQRRAKACVLGARKPNPLRSRLRSSKTTGSPQRRGRSEREASLGRWQGRGLSAHTIPESPDEAVPVPSFCSALQAETVIWQLKLVLAGSSQSGSVLGFLLCCTQPSTRRWPGVQEAFLSLGASPSRKPAYRPWRAALGTALGTALNPASTGRGAGVCVCGGGCGV